MDKYMNSYKLFLTPCAFIVLLKQHLDKLGETDCIKILQFLDKEKGVKNMNVQNFVYGFKDMNGTWPKGQDIYEC